MRIIDKKGIDAVLVDIRARGENVIRGIEQWLKAFVKKIRLVSSAGTGHFYTTDKNKRNMPGKFEDLRNSIE